MAWWSSKIHILEYFLSASTMVPLLLGTGIWLTVQFRCFQLRGMRLMLQNSLSSLLCREKRSTKGNISSFQAVSTALAGTMGVGNIAGVSTAIVAGGPGAVVWMWIGAFFGMMTKYAEIFLAVLHRRQDAAGRYFGGPMYYIQDRFGTRGFASVFSVLCVLCSFGIGNMAQVNAISTTMKSWFHIPLWVSGVVVALLVACVIAGGVTRITHITEIVIPCLSVLYICIALTYLFLHRQMLPEILNEMLTCAFQLRPAVGGLAGYQLRQTMLIGLSRGVFTNEAGLGSAPIAHASADCRSAWHQGLWGIFEVFLDTIVFCTLTAAVVLIAGRGQLWKSGLNGAALTAAAFADTFGRFGGIFIASSIVFYAIAAMLGWCFYGESALQYLCKGKQTPIFGYRMIFLFCIVIGAAAQLTTVWRISDCLNSLMAIPNIIAVLALRHEIQIHPPNSVKVP